MWNASDGAASCNVYRAKSTEEPYDLIAAGATNISYKNGELTNRTRCYYLVTAVGGGGESAFSNENSEVPKSLRGRVQSWCVGQHAIPLRPHTSMGAEWDLGGKLIRMCVPVWRTPRLMNFH